jgi:hypothetical protein
MPVSPWESMSRWRGFSPSAVLALVVAAAVDSGAVHAQGLPGTLLGGSAKAEPEAPRAEPATEPELVVPRADIALGEAGIDIPFPQGDVRVRTVDPAGAGRIGERDTGEPRAPGAGS